jgi:hypothetical protein
MPAFPKIFMCVILKQQTVCDLGPYLGFAATTADTVTLRFLLCSRVELIPRLNITETWNEP